MICLFILMLVCNYSFVISSIKKYQAEYFNLASTVFSNEIKSKTYGIQKKLHFYYF